VTIDTNALQIIVILGAGGGSGDDVVNLGGQRYQALRQAHLAQVIVALKNAQALSTPFVSVATCVP
jgi:hypothetical protein